MEIAAVISFLALVVAWMGLPAGVRAAEVAPRMTTRAAVAKA